MTNALEIGKSSTSGGFHLLMGVAGSTIIMAIGTFVLAGLLDANQVGLYGIALIPSTIIGFFRDWGVNSALTQRIANLRVTGKESEIRDTISTGIIFEIITGAILSLVCFVIAEPLAYLLSPENVAVLTLYISILSASILGGAIFAAASGIFIGFEKMRFNSFVQIFQAVIKTALGPILIIIGFGVLGAIYAVLTSIIAGGVIAILIAYFTLFKPLLKNKISQFNFFRTLKPLLSYGLPLTISTMVIGVLPQVFAFTMAIYAGTEMMGNYYVSTYFVSLLTFITFPVINALFPVFSKLDPKSELETIKRVFVSSVKYMSILLIPATLLLITLSTPIISLLFPEEGFLNSLLAINPAQKYPYAPLFLSLSCLINLLALIGNFTLTSFQNGIGQTRQVMKQSLLALSIGLPLAFFLVGYLSSVGGSLFAVAGGIVGNLVATLANVGWGIYWCWKKFGVKADFHVSARILSSSIFAAIPTYLFINYVSLPYIALLLGGFVIFMFSYLTLAPIVGAINKTDITNLKTMTSGLGVISKIINVPLSYMQKMLNSEKHKNYKTALTTN